MNKRAYSSAEGFKTALEQRIRSVSSTGRDFARRRQLLVFDRFLARIFLNMGQTMVLKGGLVLELRVEGARATKDVDLRFLGSPDGILESLQEAGQIDLGDFMTFKISPDPTHPEIVNSAMPYVGMRYRAEARLGGKIFGQPFGVDIGFADPIIGKPEILVGRDLLSFIGVKPPEMRVYPIESHIAEKLHAYTMPRGRENSRVKDLPDIALLATIRDLDATRLRLAVEQTFAFRSTHAIPVSLPDPPPFWTNIYSRLAEENNLAWLTLPDLVAAVRLFLNPILTASAITYWSPSDWTWK